MASLNDILDELAAAARNNALEAAAKVAKLYGAPDEAVERILMLRGEKKQPIERHPHPTNEA